MNQELNDRVLAVIQASGTNDYDQRSALGMARTWLDKHEPVVRTSHVYGKRDDLAGAIIAEIETMDRDDALDALREARTFVNAPYLDPTMNGQRLGRAAILKPGGASDKAGESA